MEFYIMRKSSEKTRKTMGTKIDFPSTRFTETYVRETENLGWILKIKRTFTAETVLLFFLMERYTKSCLI